MKSYRGSSGTTPLILNLDTRWRKVNLSERYPVTTEQVAGLEDMKKRKMNKWQVWKIWRREK
jgi:hypothetical protein